MQDRGDVKVGKDKSWKLDTILKIDDRQLKTPKHDEMCLWVSKNIKKVIFPYLLKKYSFWDANLLCECPFLLEWEEPIKNNGFVIGIPDFRYKIIVDEGTERTGHRKILADFIEIKPTIDSLGEVMRQLKLYKSYCLTPEGFVSDVFKFYLGTRAHKYYADFFLVTSMPDFKDVFETQEIQYFILTDEMMNNGKK